MSVNSNPSTTSHASGSKGWATTGCSLTCASLAAPVARYAAWSPPRHTAPSSWLAEHGELQAGEPLEAAVEGDEVRAELDRLGRQPGIGDVVALELQGADQADEVRPGPQSGP